VTCYVLIHEGKYLRGWDDDHWLPHWQPVLTPECLFSEWDFQLLRSLSRKWPGCEVRPCVLTVGDPVRVPETRLQVEGS
jgi:hypothetical protein